MKKLQIKAESKKIITNYILYLCIFLEYIYNVRIYKLIILRNNIMSIKNH